MYTEIKLTPAQRVAAEGLINAIPAASVLVLQSSPGKGRTTILRSVQAATGGTLVGVKDFMRALIARQPSAIEEAFLDVIENRFERHDLVIVDDFHLIRNVVDRFEYPRQGLLDAILTALLDKAETEEKRILFGVDQEAHLPSVGLRASVWQVREFAPSDYEVICSQKLAQVAACRLDYTRIHRFAPMLNLWQLRNACATLSQSGEFDTDKFVEYLGAHNLVSNVNIEEVRP